MTRPPLELPSGLDYPVEGKLVRFCHPALSPPHNILFSLIANDDGGLHYGLAHTACAIVANNKFHGYLATDTQGAKVEKEWDDMLKGDQYFFFVPETEAAAFEASSGPSPYLYPIVPSFYHWHFPHQRLPQQWANAPVRADSTQQSQSTALVIRDGSCRVTKHAAACENAHLVPQREEPWFTRESMSVYNKNQTQPVRNLGTSSLRDSQNMLLLRADIHCLFDQANFCFFPRNGKLVVHVLVTGSEVVNTYHDREMQECRSGIAFIFARFAWAIFKRLTGFLNARVPRKLLTVNGVQETTLDGMDMTEFLDGPPLAPRAPSPKKRKADGLPFDPQQSADWDEEADAPASSPPSTRKRHYMPESDGHNDEASHKRQKQTHEAIDPPPTPPDSASAASTTPSEERDDCLAGVDECDWLSEEEKRIRRMKIHALYQEGLRSDPTRWFKKELAWAHSLAGGPVDDITRWHQAYGYDVLDAEFDFGEPIVGSEQELEGNKGAGAGKGELTEERVGQLALKVKERVVGSVAFEEEEEDDRVEVVSEGKGMGGMSGERMACLGVLMEEGEGA